jgi:hypothetical protein
MNDRREAPTDTRETLRDWFVEEMSVVDTSQPVSSPPRPPEPLSSTDATRPRLRFLLTNAAVVVALVAGLIALARRDVDQTEPQSPPTETSVLSSIRPGPVGLEAILTDACEQLRDGTPQLPLGADITEIERVSTSLVTALDRADATLSRARGEASVEEIRELLTEVRSRTVDLPRVAAATSNADGPMHARETIDQAVDNVDLLLSALGRRIEQYGGRNCVDVATLRERS